MVRRVSAGLCPAADLGLGPPRQLVHHRRGVTSVTDGEPVPARKQVRVAPDVALIRPLRQDPQSTNQVGGLVPVDGRRPPLGGDRGVHHLRLLQVESRVFPRRPLHRVSVNRRHLHLTIKLNGLRPLASQPGTRVSAIIWTRRSTTMLYRSVQPTSLHEARRQGPRTDGHRLDLVEPRPRSEPASPFAASTHWLLLSTVSQEFFVGPTTMSRPQGGEWRN
jgi:hypothetical protein